MKRMHVKLTFIEPVLGTWPSNQNIAREFIASKSPDAESIEDEVAGWETEQGGEEDGGGLHCSGLDRDGDRHGADGTDGKRTAALVCVVRAGGECGCNSRNAADRGISEMS